jgi:hypothetical protein
MPGGDGQRGDVSNLERIFVDGIEINFWNSGITGIRKRIRKFPDDRFLSSHSHIFPLAFR